MISPGCVCSRVQTAPVLVARGAQRRSSVAARPSVPLPSLLHRSRPAAPRKLLCRAEGDSALSSTELLGGKVDPGDLKWSRATVVENKEASVDGSLRTLVLSVEDHVNFLDGRKVKHVQEYPRWVDAYKVPGQSVAVRYCQGGRSVEDCPEEELVVGRQLQAIASSPYEARRDSAMLDATIIELLVSRRGDDDEKVLAELGPGCLIEVSNVVGKGYASIFDSRVALTSALEDCKPLVMVAMGSRGIAPLHAALTWTPVQAHATAHRVALFYVAESQSSAAYLVEWDAWREAGVLVKLIYLVSTDDGTASSAGPVPEEALEAAILGGEHGLRGLVGCDARDVVVLMSGVPGDAAAHLTRRLTGAGVPGEHIIFCDYL